MCHSMRKAAERGHVCSAATAYLRIRCFERLLHITHLNEGGRPLCWKKGGKGTVKNGIQRPSAQTLASFSPSVESEQGSRLIMPHGLHVKILTMRTPWKSEKPVQDFHRNNELCQTLKAGYGLVS